MKTTMYLLSFILIATLSLSCTVDDAVEEGIEYENQAFTDYGEADTPFDDDRER